MNQMQQLLWLDSLLALVLFDLKAHQVWSRRQKHAQRARDIRLFWLLYHAFHSHQK